MRENEKEEKKNKGAKIPESEKPKMKARKSPGISKICKIFEKEETEYEMRQETISKVGKIRNIFEDMMNEKTRKETDRRERETVRIREERREILHIFSFVYDSPSPYIFTRRCGVNRRA